MTALLRNTKPRTPQRPQLLALALLAALPALAETSRQPEVVVTATRTALAIEQTLSSVSVIDRHAIEASGSADVVDLLRQQAGVDIIRGGGIGAQASVFLRGANSNQVLVLIDGVRVASSNTGGYTWEHLALAQVERIEIVRGPRAALYGSDAIGGVIQIFTRRAEGYSAAIGVGNHHTASGEAALAMRGANGGFGLRVGLLDTAGFNAQNPDGFAFDPDRDGAIQRNLAAQGDWDFSGLRLDGSLLHNDDDVEFDQGQSTVRTTSAQLGLAGGGEREWQLRGSHARQTTLTPDYFARFESRRNQLDWQQALPLAEAGELLWGATLGRERGRSIDTFAAATQYGDTRNHWAGFAAWRAGRGAFDWELASRHDDYDGFGGETTAQAALGWRLSDRVRLRGNLGEGFRAPNLNELYSPGFGGGFFAGNPALQPEQARTAELAIETTTAAWQWSLRGYRTTVRDLVDFSGGDTFQAINIGRARLQGAELDGSWQHAEWRLSGNLGWQQADNLISGAALLRRAPRKANVGLERRLGAGWLGVDLHAAAARPEFGGELPGYALTSVSWRLPLSDQLNLDLRVDNLFDRHYELARGFNSPGTTALLQLRWQSN